MNPALFLVMLAAFFWGLIGVFVKAFSAWGFSPMQITALRAYTSFLIMVLVLAFKSPRSFAFRLKDSWLFFGTGVLSFTLMNFSYFTAISHVGLTVSAVLLYTSPAFIMILSALFFKESITGLKLFALGLAVGGSALVSGVGSFPLQSLNVQGIFFGLLSGFSYALYSIFGRAALGRYSVSSLTFYTFAFAALGIFALSDTAGLWVKISSPKIGAAALLFGLVCSVLPFFLYSRGLQKLSNTAAGLTACLEPVVASCVGIIFFGEALPPLRIAGIALIIGALFILSMQRKTQAV